MIGIRKIRRPKITVKSIDFDLFKFLRAQLMGAREFVAQFGDHRFKAIVDEMNVSRDPYPRWMQEASASIVLTAPLRPDRPGGKMRTRLPRRRKGRRSP